MSVEILDDIVRRQKRGEVRGIVSICSAHPDVLQAAMRRAARSRTPVLVEATCNQVNQFGGYTGMTPEAFVNFVHEVAEENGLPPEQVLLGGDHLGPSAWQDGPTERAMQRAAELVQAYVQAGFVKIHLDASMKLGGDNPARPLDVELAAQRLAWLTKAAEQALEKVPQSARGLRYVIGTEVPIPGGAQTHEEGVQVTKVEDARRTLEVTHAAFVEAGLEAAWGRVIAMVVQPGVEFGDDFVLDYKPEAARDLARFSELIRFVYEAHSTDYQTRENLQNLVRDHFAILKVGPALTFAFREAVFALTMIESELVPAAERSHLVKTLDEAMRRKPDHWKKHYHGTSDQKAFARKFSLSDRIRYYWPDPQVQAALKKLLANLSRSPLPLTLLNQFAPVQYEHIREGRLENSPRALILDQIDLVLENYAFAGGE